ncbi:TlpA family protein disulfide reductase [Aquiflexum sp.]|uniref:TlpA family protein disulfide reductase n=1 Tax=Aquiflexum sp. TaxID=1872584 RepID=UPI003593710C
MKVLLLCLLLVFSNSYSNESSDQSKTESTFRIISYPEFEEMLKTTSNKIKVYNFWATWCGPCVKEMPYFEKIQAEDSSIELIFISMDDGRKPERVTSFIDKKRIKAPVYLLNDVDYNKWIDKVDPSWSGAIPATLFIKSDGTKSFHEGELTEKELKLIINQLK